MEQKLCVLPEVSIRDAISVLVEGGKKVVFVVSPDQKLLGIMTNGDMRRFLLTGKSLSLPVTDAMNPHPTVFHSVEDAQAEKSHNAYIVYPIVSPEGILMDALFPDEYEAATQASNTLENVPLVIMAGGKGTRLYPYTKRYLGTFENHFSTIGLIGMNEVVLNANWLRADMSDPRTQEFTKEVLNHMRERLSDYQEQYGDLYNLEATPAESTTYRLAKHDRKRWPGIKTAGKPGDTPYYTNSSHLPVDYTVDIFDALDIQDELQTLYTSGTVFHAFLGEKLPDWKAAASLVRTIASNYKLPYYTLSPTYSICKEHGYLAGEVKVCPHCGAKTEVYSRITGYYRPVQNWNDGKLQEYANRTEYDIGRSSLKRPTRSVVTLSNFAEDVEVKVEQPQDIKYLFTTKTCPNCKLVKEYLKNVPYVTIDAEENMELARRYGVMQAPTLVVVNGDSHKKYVNASNIKKYVDQLTLVGVE